ncbi:hypothetical protein Q9Q94_15165 [Uliginosibacterium sp. 31-16]|uniref:hypothetical protein n=1 Tax=Uliginosibacterium sp. 31-16 TaxID=3068315 RepID=UPI00273FD7BA|nr:hypothetical protein [Uliginosibacterium sp. 31-16]MDP5240881.1 hypothetical protein [Uliginosibacterium sp. 31-16]
MPRTLQSLCVAPVLCVLAFLPVVAHGAVEKKETWLGLPVEFASQEYAIKGGVAVELSKLKVQTATPIEVERAWVTPDWADWITKFRMSRVRVEAGEVVARPSSLARLGLVDGPSTRKVTRLEFTSLKLLFGTSPLLLPGGEMRFAPDGALSIIKIKYEGGINLELSPREGGKLAVLVQSGALKWPVLPGFSFDSVVAQGEITDDNLLIDKIGANGDGGSVSGMLHMVSAGKLLLEGEIKMESLRARDVINRLYPRSTVDGLLSGSFKLDASADSFEGLASSVAVNGTYTIKNGSLDRFGLLEGMRRSGSGVVGGGLIRFDSLSGKFGGRTGEPAQADFQGLTSGALRGSSSFSVQQDGRLKGVVHGSLTLPGGENVSRSFELSGKVDAPTMSTR